MKNEKEFHCIDSKHEAQLEIYKEIKNLTPEEEIEYFRRRAETGIFGKLWKKLHGESVAGSMHNKATGVSPHHQHQSA